MGWQEKEQRDRLGALATIMPGVATIGLCDEDAWCWGWGCEVFRGDCHNVSYWHDGARPAYVIARNIDMNIPP